MRPKLHLIFVVLVMGFACISLAQGGGGTGNGFGGGRQRGGRGGGNSISRLIFRPDVQADLAITDEEKAKLEGMRDQLTAPQAASGQTLSAEERAASEEANAKKVESVLTADQVKRLHEIQIQVMGASALHNKHVQEDLGLSADQVSKLAEIYKTYQSANQTVQEKATAGTITRQESREARTKNTQELKTESEKVLTADQLAKYQALGGKPFVAAAPTGGRRGGGGGGAGGAL